MFLTSNKYRQVFIELWAFMSAISFVLVRSLLLLGFGSYIDGVVYLNRISKSWFIAGVWWVADHGFRFRLKFSGSSTSTAKIYRHKLGQTRDDWKLPGGTCRRFNMMKMRNRAKADQRSYFPGSVGTKFKGRKNVKSYFRNIFIIPLVCVEKPSAKD